MQDSVIQIRNLTKKIRKKAILDNLSLDVNRGEVFGLLGPNGAGKTTTIRMIVGLIAMSEGDVLVKGHSVSKEFEKAIQHVGAIVENPEMYKFLTGYQNLIHYARMVEGVSRSRIDEVVALVGLSRRIDEKVKTYSLGMRQRLGVAQAILHKPSVLILDEPTNGLDPSGIRELRGYLRKLAEEEDTAIIVSSHLLSEMELMCDRVAIIENGKLVDVKEVKELVKADDLVSVAFEVDKPSESKETLHHLSENSRLALVKNGFEVIIERDQIPEINAQLVRSDIKVYSIKTKSKTLEDRFLEMTGSEQIV